MVHTEAIKGSNYPAVVKVPGSNPGGPTNLINTTGGNTVSERRKVINLSINPKYFNEVHDVLDHIHDNMWPTAKSSVMCRLLLDFKKRGYKFNGEGE